MSLFSPLIHRLPLFLSLPLFISSLLSPSFIHPSMLPFLLPVFNQGWGLGHSTENVEP